jgi:predicted outer membrane repeat protein
MLALLLIIPALVASPRSTPRPIHPSRIAGADSTGLVSWTIDPTHSELSFRIRHIVSRVRGSFLQWSGTIVANPADWSTGRVEVTIETASINTQNTRRDNHLRSADFFDAATYPTITFKSSKVEMNGGAIRVTGDLTIRGITREVVLEGSFLGLARGQRGEPRAGFEVTTRINRLDYGVAWNKVVEGGGMLLGDDVDIDIVIAASTTQSS